MFLLYLRWAENNVHPRLACRVELDTGNPRIMWVKSWGRACNPKISTMRDIWKTILWQIYLYLTLFKPIKEKFISWILKRRLKFNMGIFDEHVSKNPRILFHTNILCKVLGNSPKFKMVGFLVCKLLISEGYFIYLKIFAIKQPISLNPDIEFRGLH